MIATAHSLQDKTWFKLWNRSLIFLMMTIYFLDGVTRYKHLITILISLTILYYAVKAPKTQLALLKNNIFYSILALSFSIFYGYLISPDHAISFKNFNNDIIKGVLFYAIAIPIVLQKEDISAVTKIIIYSFISSLVLKCSVEIVLYIIDYKNNIMPFTNYNHRHISDSMVFLFPAFLGFYLTKNIKIKACFLIFSIIFVGLLLGTLSRGAWIAIFLISLIWLLYNRQWKTLLMLAVAASLAVAFIFSQPTSNHNKLIWKLHQTDSSSRYQNGTQGAAMNLIMENPLKGYGYGDDIYHAVYNKRIIDYPQWVFKKSIGPHNILLYVWFGAGIFGLITLISCYFCIAKKCMGKSNYGTPYNTKLVILLSLVGFFIIRGSVEQVELEPLGLLSGFLTLLLNSEKKPIQAK